MQTAKVTHRIPLTPLLGGPIAARCEQMMQHRDESTRDKGNPNRREAYSR